MRYVLTWRYLIGAIGALLICIPFFLWWERQGFAIFSSVELNRFIVMWWWLLVVSGLGIAVLAGLVLILCDTKHQAWTRVAWVCCSALLPLLLPVYWLVRVEPFRPNNSFKPKRIRGSA